MPITPGLERTGKLVPCAYFAQSRQEGVADSGTSGTAGGGRKQHVGSGPVGAQDGTRAPSNGRLPPGNAGGLGVQRIPWGGAAVRWTGRRFR